MRYSLKKLLEMSPDEFENLHFLPFYTHPLRERKNMDEACCSQWYPAEFRVDDVLYRTAEHFMMAEKARFFGDEKSLQNILHSTDPGEAKAFGRNVKNFDSARWAEVSFEIVIKGNLAKFGTHPDLREWLLASAPSILVETSPTDKIWGVGLAKHDPRASQPHQWLGKNLLGFALMHVRDELALSRTS